MFDFNKLSKFFEKKTSNDQNEVVKKNTVKDNLKQKETLKKERAILQKKELKTLNLKDNKTQHHAINAISTTLARSTFLRKSFYTQQNYINILIIAVLVQSAIIFALMFKGENYRYFATDTTGRIQKLTPLKSPIQTTDFVLEWTKKAYVKAHSFNFANYREAFQEMRPFFTPKGWVKWKESLKNSQVIDRVIKERLVSTAVVQGAPIVYREGSINNRYQWVIDVPLLITYQSSGQVINQNVKARIRVLRVSQTTHPSGLAIHQILEKGGR